LRGQIGEEWLLRNFFREMMFQGKVLMNKQVINLKLEEKIAQYQSG